MSAIPSAKAKPYPKVSTGVTFFPHLLMTVPHDDKTSPATIGLISNENLGKIEKEVFTRLALCATREKLKPQASRNVQCAPWE
jgi:hypothetical protein